MKVLSREEFAAALKKGLGRAWWHIAEHGLDDVADLVLEACLHDQRHDAQAEPNRAGWLLEMFGATAHYSRFRTAILGALQTETNTWDLEQLCGLAKELVVHGDDGARQALRDFVFNKASQCADDDSLGACAWIELTGVEGVIDLAKIYGQRLIVDPDDQPNHYLRWAEETENDYKAALLRQVQTDPAIAAYCKYLETFGTFTPSQPVERETDRQQRWQRIREEYPLEWILDDAKDGISKPLTRFATFGRYATPEELEIVYAALLNATEVEVRLRLLWVFRRVPLPRLADVFFDWAINDNEELRSAVIGALAEVSDERVHALAQSKVESGQLTGVDNDVLALFLNNYQGEDAALINCALSGVKPETDEDAHSLGLNLLNLVERHDDPQLTPSLCWAYEYTPCTFCRSSVVKLLDRFDALDDTLVQECLHDAEPDTRAIAQQRLNASPREAPLS